MAGQYHNSASTSNVLLSSFDSSDDGDDDDYGVTGKGGARYGRRRRLPRYGRSSSGSGSGSMNEVEDYMHQPQRRQQRQETLDEAVQLRVRQKHRCRFCCNYTREMQDNRGERGYKVCACDDQFGYAHRVCFYRFLGGPEGRATCPHCRQLWYVAPKEVAPFMKRKSRVRIWRSVHFVTSAAIGLLGLLAAMLLFAYMIKGLVYAASGSPEFNVTRTLPVRLEPSPGDFVTGGSVVVALLLLYALHRLLAACVPSYRHCGGHRQPQAVYGVRSRTRTAGEQARLISPPLGRRNNGESDDGDDDDDAVELETLSEVIVASERDWDRLAREEQLARQRQQQQRRHLGEEEKEKKKKKKKTKKKNATNSGKDGGRLPAMDDPSPSLDEKSPVKQQEELQQ